MFGLPKLKKQSFKYEHEFKNYFDTHLKVTTFSFWSDYHQKMHVQF